MQTIPSIFPLWHILLTAAIAFAGSLTILFAARSRTNTLTIAECIGMALVVGASVVIWRAVGNVPVLNDDPVPPFSPNDILCPVITYVCLNLYDGLHHTSDRVAWPGICSMLVIVSLVVNVIVI